MKAWLFQDSQQKKKLGDNAPWSVAWHDPEGKQRSKKIGSKSMADKFRRKKEGELAAGLCSNDVRKSWSDFRKEYEAKIATGMIPKTKAETLRSIDHFERIIKPHKTSAIKTQAIDDYIAKRRTEAGKKPKSKVSPATINKELRHIKALLNVASEWGYLTRVPKIRMLKEPAKLVLYVTADDLSSIYDACDKAAFPKESFVQPGDWWRALVTQTEQF